MAAGAHDQGAVRLLQARGNKLNLRGYQHISVPFAAWALPASHLLAEISQHASFAALAGGCHRLAVHLAALTWWWSAVLS